MEDIHVAKRRRKESYHTKEREVKVQNIERADVPKHGTKSKMY